jgi:bifunctional DNA-binding transcriptional regulator/antitoxin component of YhaV-PrlF toxin-antitoxin module
MANAYVSDENSIKLPAEISRKLKLEKGMKLQIISNDEEGIIMLKIPEKKHDKDFSKIKGVGKEIWQDMDAQDFVKSERNEWS